MWVLNTTLGKYISGAAYDVLGNKDKAYKISKHLNESERYTVVIQAVSIRELERNIAEGSGRRNVLYMQKVYNTREVEPKKLKRKRDTKAPQDSNSNNKAT
jgi:hypothetical protein